MKDTILQTIKISIASILLSVGIGYVFASTHWTWTPPPVPPPGGNTAPPINVGDSDQTKTGGDLTISGGDMFVTEDAGAGGIFTAKTGFFGDVTASGQVCDSNGCIGAGGLWNQNGTDIYYNGGNVGVGTGNPDAKLTISGGGTPIGPNGNLRIGDQGIQFGGPNSGMEVNSAQISAGRHIPNSLNIVGMGSNGSNRRVDMWAEGGLNVYGNQSISGGLTVNNRLTVSEAGGAYTYITLRDDESPNGVKYIHANSNNVGFLSGGGGWLARWDDAGNMVNTGDLSIASTLSTPGRMHITGGESLYLLNSSGVIVSRAWGGNGNLTVEGNLTANGNVWDSITVVNSTTATDLYCPNGYFMIGLRRLVGQSWNSLICGRL